MRKEHNELMDMELKKNDPEGYKKKKEKEEKERKRKEE